MSNYVIIGNSTAAINCVEGIRSLDKEGKITIVSNEPHFTYGRPLISYLLYGKTDLQRMKYRPDNWYEENGVQTKLGVTVLSIDAKNQTIQLSDDSSLPYDKLLVATGSRPFVPPMQGIEKVKTVYSFMTLNDALAIEKDFSKEDDVLVVGAGLIGLKCVEGILDRVHSVTVVDLADRVLPSILDEDASSLVKSYLECKGVKFILSDSVAEFESAGVATLKSGNKVAFTKLVLAVGVRPNVELVQNAGGKVERGICVDERCQTTIPNVYSAGDCALSHDITIDADRILALLPNASYQGRCAGINMAGGESVFDKAIPMNAMGLLGLHMITAGSYDGEVYKEVNGENYKELFVKDNVLKGFILIGDVKRAGIYTSMVREKTPIDSVNFDLLKTKPVLAAFSKSQRAEKLTKEV